MLAEAGFPSELRSFVSCVFVAPSYRDVDFVEKNIDKNR